MSVGTGSIKRAANAVNTAGNKTNEEMAAKSETIQRAENRLAARKAGIKYVEPKAEEPRAAENKKEGKKEETKAASAVAETVETAKEDSVSSAEKKVENVVSSAESSSAGAAGKYEAYGIGQELPVYLM